MYYVLLGLYVALKLRYTNKYRFGFKKVRYGVYFFDFFLRLWCIYRNTFYGAS